MAETGLSRKWTEVAPRPTFVSTARELDLTSRNGHTVFIVTAAREGLNCRGAATGWCRVSGVGCRVGWNGIGWNGIR